VTTVAGCLELLRQAQEKDDNKQESNQQQ